MAGIDGWDDANKDLLGKPGSSCCLVSDASGCSSTVPGCCSGAPGCRSCLVFLFSSSVMVNDLLHMFGFETIDDTYCYQLAPHKDG